MKEPHLPNDFLAHLNLDGKSDIILDLLPVGVEIYAPDGNLIYMNETDARIFGVDRVTLLRSGLSIFDNPNLSDEVKDALRNRTKIHKRFPYNFNLVSENYYNNTENKPTIQVECNGRPIVGSDGQLELYIFIIEDVTESARKEEELLHNRRKTEMAIRDSDIMLWEFDVVSRIFYSDNEPLNAYDRSQPISIELYMETVHPDDKKVLSDLVERMIAGEDFNFSYAVRILFPDNPEWQYCTVNGSAYEYDAAGKVIRYVGTRKNNTELQTREMMLSKILNSIPLPIHIKDVEDNFHYVFCNDESKRMFGTSEEKTAFDVMSEEQVARIEKTDKEVYVTGNPYLGSEHIVLKDGRSYDTIVRKSVFYDGDRRLLLNVRWDQSLQRDLERRSKLLSISMEAMDAYSWFFIPCENSISFGEGFTRPGRDISRLNTLDKFLESIHPEDRKLFNRSINDTIETKSERWDVEYRVDLDGSGVYEWWQTRGLLETILRDDEPYKYMYGMSINIDAHKQTELTLLHNKEELDRLISQNELVLNNTNSGLAYITTDYVVQWENITLCAKHLAFETYEKGVCCFKSARGREEPCENNCVLRKAIETEQVQQVTLPRGNDRVIEIFATPVFKEGKIDGVVVRVDDITERERMIEELREARAQAVQSDRLKSAFLANMSHEIRTPLNAIVGFSELLISAPEHEDREEYIRIINNNNELLLKLINDILDLSKIEAGSVELKYEDFNLAEYFNEMASSMRHRIKNPNVRLVAVNPYMVCNVRLDKNRVAQIFTNYVTNAIKYTPKGFIEMGYEGSGDGVRFYVRDSGIGISEEKKDKVFHRFEKLDEFAQGTGLGLSICKAIAESMGGSVGFESQAGEGSLFWAFLPCKPELDISAEPKISVENTNQKYPQRADASVSNGARMYKVLVAEDIPSNYLLVSSMLKNRYKLIPARNGKDAVELVRSHCPDVVLMDMKMPVMDGLQATIEIRKFNTEVPIVALTAHAYDADRQAALAAGCNDYLVKPISKQELLAVLDKFSDAFASQNGDN